MNTKELFSVHLPSAIASIFAALLLLQDPGDDNRVLTAFVIWGMVISIQLITLALKRIKKSNLSEIAKPCWVFVVLFFPIIGSISALVIIDAT